MDEKRGDYYQPQSSPGPPAYGAAPTPSWPPLCQATALYAYTASDKGDLELTPNDHINVTEYLNAEWWKGRSTRTGQEGIFPRSYVKVIEAPAPSGPSNYGNVPMDVAQSGQPNKAGEAGKKIGKKSFSLMIIFAPILTSIPQTWQCSYLWCWCDNRKQSCQQHLLSGASNMTDLRLTRYVQNYAEDTAR